MIILLYSHIASNIAMASKVVTEMIKGFFFQYSVSSDVVMGEGGVSLIITIPILKSLMLILFICDIQIPRNHTIYGI